MKKFILRTLVTFSILFVFYFLITMVLEYKNKDFLKENVDVEVTIDDNGEILIPNTPGKVQANYEFSIFYFFFRDISISKCTNIIL